MSEQKKLHIYRVELNGEAVFVRAPSRQQAISAVAARYITATRAEAIDVLNAGVSWDTIIDHATTHSAQEALPLPTVAETMEAMAAEPGVINLAGIAGAD